MKKLPLIYIEWSDAISPFNSWRTEEEALEWSKNVDYFVAQIGWIIKEDSKFLLLSSQRNFNEDGEGQFAHIIRIPKTWIRKRKKIKV